MGRRVLVMFAVLIAMGMLVGCQSDVMKQVGAAKAKSIGLDELEIGKAQSGRRPAQVNKSVGGNPITMSSTVYEKGLGVNAPWDFWIDLGGKATRFTAIVGIDDEVRTTQSQQTQRRWQRGPSVDFVVVGDGRVLWQSGVMRSQNEPNKVDVDLTGIKILRLVVKDVQSNYSDHADWAMATIEYAGAKAPAAMDVPVVEKYILTPKPAAKPRLTGPRIFGARPGNPFLFTVTATGERPMEFSAEDLPTGLTLDSRTGRITGAVEKEGKFTVKLKASNSRGTAERELRIVVGDTIALTPPMGWNSWNCWGESVSDAKVRASAKAMVDTGLINHGWSYINIDDVWMRAEHGRWARDPNTGPPARDPNGDLIPNAKFPDMKALTDYIHGLGLKAGIYISPGPTTCAGLMASYQHELQDAQKFAEWGFDYLKYDWCGYRTIAPRDPNLEWLKKPYILMRECLDQVPRDIVYSLCQYGMGNVWTWGAEVGGNSWRTTGDIGDSWQSISTLGFGESDHARYAGPGHWNDPDMLVLGKVGWGPNLHDCSLTPDEQYTHVSLWCLVCSPLLIGCPIEQLDAFTLSLLSNDEVLEVSQDPLGQAARRIAKDGDKEVWAKPMEDRSVAVGLFNRYDYAPQTVTVKLADLGIQGSAAVRNLWHQKNLGTFKDQFSAKVPVHGVVLVRVRRK
jgi:alpha-galactosidase